MKKIITLLALIVAALPAFAGGLTTNTNLSASFLRNPGHDAIIGVDGVYSNPAGVIFLGEGLHLQFNWQAAFQHRDIASEFAPFAYGQGNGGQADKLYRGKAQAPFVPSLHAVYNWEKWSASFSFGVTGGGGKCTFDDGLGSFEASASMLPVLGANLGARVGNDAYNITGYSIDSYMKGQSYQFGFQLGTTYKATDNLSVFLGLRVNYATCNYYGYIQDIKVELAGNPGTYVSAKETFTQLGEAIYASAYGQYYAAYTAAGLPAETAQAMALQATDANSTVQSAVTSMNTLATATEDVTLNCDQQGIGFQPIISVDYRINEHWNLAAKYEFRTRLSLKNESANSASADNLSALAQFRDGAKVRDDIPAYFTVGAQYSPIQKLRIMAGYHLFFDKDAKKYNNAQDKLSGNTWELNAGVEYDINEHWTVSCGWQQTNIGNTDDYIKDISFNTNSNNLGVGFCWNINPHWSLDFGYFQSFYKHYRRTVSDYNGTSSLVTMTSGAETAAATVASGALTGKDSFTRKNCVLGLGITMHF